ncbi:uncharacterized protein K02A2.6-like [Teleopsis dalmanni]|uniref:uncharacterized protein K02A2.6-like n=1 Tax=Teleopsis dalmanni TaxID=139649 RepID=UPI0018CF6108|nr:uncharacterized protein K02A2.6-like [Teleopsis dalmanni]
MLRDRLVCGMRNENLQKRLLANDQLTLKIAQEEAIASETAQKNATELKTSASLPGLNKISSNKVKPNRAPVDYIQNCYRCRGNHHSDQCKFKDAECYYCKKRGHIERACIKKAKTKKPATNNGRRPNRVNLLDTNQKTQTTEYLWSMFVKGSLSVKRVITIGKSPVQMEIDSGASYSIVSEKLFREKMPYIPLKPSPIQLRTWGTEKNLKLSGEAEVPVSVGNVTKKLKLLVAAGDGPALIGRNWFNDLGITITSNLCNIESTIPVEVMNFSSVFDGKLGDYKGNPVKLQMSVSSKPKFLRYRQVPFALKLKVEATLKKLEDEGALRSISFSEWATPVVPIIKPDGSIRICGDYKCRVNQMLCKETYPLPTNTEVLAELANCKGFTKLDLDRSYTQVKADQESARILTLNTHRGLFEVTRLPFGISTAPGIFQRVMEGVLKNIDGVIIYLDDILIGEITLEELWDRTRTALKCVQDAGLKLKKSKCVFAVQEITFLGFKISREGVRLTDEKVKAIGQAPEPINKQQLQAFLGLITFYDRFLQNKGDLLELLYQLLRKEIPFKRSREQKLSFERAKKLLQSKNLLVHYSTDLSLILCGDASPYGVGVVLAHKMPDESEAPIAFGSRTLQGAERNYSQLDKEALAIMFGVQKFLQFLSGRQFTIMTDHKPLVGLFNPEKPISQHISPRMLRWSLKLGASQYEIKFREGKHHQNGDALSRLPLNDVKLQIPEIPEILYCNEVEEQFLITAKDIAQATRRDPVLSKFKPFVNKIQELSVNAQCLLGGGRVIIPAIQRPRILEMLHEVHQGMSAMKAVARSYFWWPGLDEDIEMLARRCEKCACNKKNPPVAAGKPWPATLRPWSRLHIDYAGPFMGTNFLSS